MYDVCSETFVFTILALALMAIVNDKIGETLCCFDEHNCLKKIQVAPICYLILYSLQKKYSDRKNDEFRNDTKQIRVP